MSLQRFISEAISPWMKQSGPDDDIVLSSRIRLARNIEKYTFPILTYQNEGEEVLNQIRQQVDNSHPNKLELLLMKDLEQIEKQVLVEKHLISPHLASDASFGAVLLSEDESVSIMINEEDHIRIQCLSSGLRLQEVLENANRFDDWLEEKNDFAFDEKRGYLTSCPTNVGTGMRASVMMHLPALVLTQQLNHIIPAINQLGLVVRGIYGEGSEALGNLFQISNQITLGKSEIDIVEDLKSVVLQLIERERLARQMLLQNSKIHLEDRLYRSYGVLKNCRIIDSKEAAKCLSDVRLGIDLSLIGGVSRTILNELMILTQPGFLQQYAGELLGPDQRDIRRAAIIRETLKLKEISDEERGG